MCSVNNTIHIVLLCRYYSTKYCTGECDWHSYIPSSSRGASQTIGTSSSVCDSHCIVSNGLSRIVQYIISGSGRKSTNCSRELNWHIFIEEASAGGCLIDCNDIEIVSNSSINLSSNQIAYYTTSDVRILTRSVV